MSLIIKAFRYAEECHRGVPRKYTGRPYIEHPDRVALRMLRHPAMTEPLVAACSLHDVIEDCGVTAEQLFQLFGVVVADLVLAVTNPSKQHPDLPRAERKQMDRDHIAALWREPKLIKLIDRADNLRETSAAPESFRELYLAESKLLFEALKGTDDILEAEYQAALDYVESTL